MGYAISEHRDVLLPTMVNLDGFILTHTIEPVEIPDKETVDGFIGTYDPVLYLDPKDPMTQGNFADPFHYMEFRLAQQKAMDNSIEVIRKVYRDFAKEFGRSYDLLEEYKTEDAEVIVLSVGSVVGTIKDVVDETEGVGVIKLTSFRPLPEEDLKKALNGKKVVAVVEKDVSIGLGKGAVASEIRDILYGMDEAPKVISFVAGLGGRDIKKNDIADLIATSKKAVKEDVDPVHWVGLR